MKNKIILIVLAIVVVGIVVALVAKGGKGPEINPKASQQGQCEQYCTEQYQNCLNQCASQDVQCNKSCRDLLKSCNDKCASEGGCYCSSGNLPDQRFNPNCGQYLNKKDCENSLYCHWICGSGKDGITIPGELPGVPGMPIVIPTPGEPISPIATIATETVKEEPQLRY